MLLEPHYKHDPSAKPLTSSIPSPMYQRGGAAISFKKSSPKSTFPPADAIFLGVKGIKQSAEKRTSGTTAVETHRPAMNKLGDAARRRLRQRAAKLLYGHEAVPSGR
jgi:hypothetical protein